MGDTSFDYTSSCNEILTFKNGFPEPYRDYEETKGDTIKQESSIKTVSDNSSIATTVDLEISYELLNKMPSGIPPPSLRPQNKSKTQNTEIGVNMDRFKSKTEPCRNPSKGFGITLSKKIQGMSYEVLEKYKSISKKT